MSVVLSVQNVKKRIGKKWIIKGISFDVHEGEIFGFLGPNGSGKTTTIRMLVDLVRPTEGNIYICGYDVQKQHDQAMLHVGCIVENPELYPFLSGWENLEVFSRMLPGVGPERIREVTEIVGLEQRIHDKVKTYSLGMRQRLGIAQALLGNPKLLILDEPTNGLDPQGIKEMRDFIRRLAHGGLSIFVSSHLLSEVQVLCDRVAILSHGEVLAVGRVDELLQQSGIRVHWKVTPHEQGIRTFSVHQHVKIVDILRPTEDEDLPVIVTEMNAENIPSVNRSLVDAGLEIHAIEVRSLTLEDLFLKLTEGERID